MNVDHLVHMANRIGEFFAAQPDRQEAKDGIVLHLLRFWEPRMRRALLAHVEGGSAAGLCDLVLEAVREQRAALLPRGATPSEIR